MSGEPTPLGPVTMATFARHAKSDVAFMLEQSGRHVDASWPLRWVSSRPARAAMLMRLCGQSRGLGHLLLKEILGSAYACDVASGAKLGTPLYIPHPTGIVIGSGAIVQGRVALFQHVTLGRGVSPSYPIVEHDSYLYVGASVIGAVTVSAGSRIKAHQLVVEERNDRSA